VGVSREDIAADYCISQIYLQDMFEAMRTGALTIRPGKTHFEPYVFQTPFEAMIKFYDFLAAEYGSVRGYLLDIGVTEESLKKLGESGLDELRFNLGASNCADKVIENMKIAKKYIPYVGIETPMTPSLYEAFLQKKGAILSTGLDFMNSAELHLNPNNIENYWGADMYMYRLGYLAPILSHELTLKLMRRAAEEKWPIAIHDCCNATKFARDRNLLAHQGGWFGASAWGMEFPVIPYAAFLPILGDPDFQFLEEEPLPKGYGVGEGTI
jgi:pyruvate formate-lyase activating enzyme-like uncharacterized protein